MTIIWELKALLVERYGSQVEAAKAMSIRESRLSYIIRGHTGPTERERVGLEQALGKKKVRRLLATPGHESGVT